MRVALISEDREFEKRCAEILAGLPGRHSVITAVEAEQLESDLYVWDLPPNRSIPAIASRYPARHLVLVHRKDLARFRENTSNLKASILLKPVTRATLAAFLSLAAAEWGDSRSSATSLRADRDEILQCLIQTNLRLQEYDQDRTDFLARAVHDFRAPLTALTGYCGLLLAGTLGPLNEEQKGVLRRMQHSGQRLSHMASAMFQLSVGPQVKRHSEANRGDIRDCVEQSLYEIAPFTQEKRIAITVDMAPCAEPQYFAAGDIEQVLVNLLENACKFTPKAGAIRIAGYPYFWERRSAGWMKAAPVERRRREFSAPNAYRIDIRDSGVSIPDRHLADIFEEYTSYGADHERSGGGLGLAICKMIINQHEGRIWAENTPFGPLFSFVLPFRRGGQVQSVSATRCVA